LNDNLSTIKTKGVYVLNATQEVFFSPVLSIPFGATQSNFRQIAGQIFLKLNN